MEGSCKGASLLLHLALSASADEAELRRVATGQLEVVGVPGAALQAPLGPPGPSHLLVPERTHLLVPGQ